MEEFSIGRTPYSASPGSVNDVYDLLSAYDNHIVGEHMVKIEHALLGLPGSRLEDVHTVYSHPQGLMQCSRFLDEHRDWQQDVYKRQVKERFDIPVSVDTYKSRVAEAAIEAGADMINDIWGLKYDPELAGVIGKSGLPCCLMHNRKTVEYRHFMSDCLEDLKETLKLAETGGIEKDKIILDPGVGFGKTYEHNLIVMKHLEEFRKLG